MLAPAPLQLPGRGVSRQLRSRVLQSPLAGVSDRVFRRLVRRWCPDALLFTEMVNATSLEMGHGRGKVEELATEEGPIGVQLFDHRPQAMAEAAKRAQDAGAFLIDINMGCPVKKIAKKGGGSGLIRDPTWLPDRGAVASGASARHGQNPAGVVRQRCRSGELVPAATNAGAQLLTLHGRTRERGFKGQADWQAIAQVEAALTIPVIAGDINTPEDAQHCMAITGADGVMVGQGSMGAPWLVGQIDAELRGSPIPAAPDASGRLQLAKEQLLALVSERGDHGLLIARKHMGWTCTGFPGAPQLRHQLMRAPTPAAAVELLNAAAASVETAAAAG